MIDFYFRFGVSPWFRRTITEDFIKTEMKNYLVKLIEWIFWFCVEMKGYVSYYVRR